MSWTDVEIAWVAGLLEGEGHFGVTYDKRAIRVTCSMTDQDTIIKLHSIVGGRLQSPADPSGGRKRIYPWNLSVREEVVALITELRPYMSSRRQGAIDEMLQYDKDHPKSPSRSGRPPAHGTYSRYTSKKYACRCPDCKKANTLHMREYKRKVTEVKGGNT